MTWYHGWHDENILPVMKTHPSTQFGFYYAPCGGNNALHVPNTDYPYTCLYVDDLEWQKQVDKVPKYSAIQDGLFESN